MVNATPRPLYRRERDPIPIVESYKGFKFLKNDILFCCVAFQHIGREGFNKTFVHYQAGISGSGNRKLIQAVKILASIHYVYPAVRSAAALH